MTIPPAFGSGEPPTAPSVHPHPVPPGVGPRPELGVGHAVRPSAPQPWSWSSFVARPPALIVAAALLVAGGLGVLQALVVLVAAPDGGLVARLGTASEVLGLPLLLVVAVALLLVRDGRRDGDEAGPSAPLDGVSRPIVVAAAGLAGAFGCLVVLGLVADLVVEGADPATRVAGFLGNLARLVVAAAGTWWSVAMLQGGDRGRAIGGAPGEPVVPAGTVVPAPPLRPEPPGGGDWRPADPGWGAQPPVWPQRPPTEGPPTAP